MTTSCCINESNAFGFKGNNFQNNEKTQKLLSSFILNQIVSENETIYCLI